jgi:hypothetical protein
MAPTKIPAAPLGFPDLSLAVPYPEGLRYAQFRLQMIARGELSHFCTLHKLPYTTVVNLKNNKLQKEGARLVQRVLRNLGVETELLTLPFGPIKQHFLFPTLESLAAFQGQLRRFDTGTLLV